MGWDNKKKDFKVSIGTSKHKNAYSAGVEVIKDTLKDFVGKPDFIMLFCSEDYEDNGGLKNFLKGFHEILSSDIPVVGGTICGFLTNKGCFARGAVALAVSYPNMNISIGYGENTKRNPKKAAKNCVRRLKPGLSNKYEHKIIFTFISGTKPVKIPGLKDTTSIRSKFLAKISLIFLSIIQKTINKGMGKEMEVIEKIIEDLSDYSLIHGSMHSGAPYLRNFQFYNKKVFKDSVVSLAINIDIPFKLDFKSGIIETDKKMKITKISKDNRIIKELNYKPAFSEFLKSLGLSKNELGDRKWTDLAVRNPISYKKNNKIISRPQLMILGDYLGVIAKIEKPNIFVGKLQAHNIINSTYKILNCDNPYLGFFPTCLSVRDFLGIKIFKIQDIFKDYFKDTPYLILFAGGEGLYKPDYGFYYPTESFTSLIFCNNNS